MDVCLIEFADGCLCVDVELADGVDFCVEEFDSDGKRSLPCVGV